MKKEVAMGAATGHSTAMEINKADLHGRHGRALDVHTTRKTRAAEETALRHLELRLLGRQIGHWPQAVGENTRCNAHAHELLEEQFAGIWNADLADGRRLALLAPKLLGLEVGNRNEAALAADVDSVGIGLFVEAVEEKCLETEDQGTFSHLRSSG